MEQEMSNLSRARRILKVLCASSPRDNWRNLKLFARSLASSNFGEDLLLARQFILPERGFFVDVGAHDPIRASNTFRLYLKGWVGLSVEPNPDLARKHERVRPECIIVNCGVGGEVGTLQYNRFDNDQYNTFSPEMTARAIERGAIWQDRISVPVKPLSQILKEAKATTVDVVSIDAEGLDFAVLKTLDFTCWRPRVILIEDHESDDVKFWNSAISQYLVDLNYELMSRVSYTSFFVDAGRKAEIMR
jgi:FkbM family methyltransferase